MVNLIQEIKRSDKCFPIAWGKYNISLLDNGRCQLDSSYARCRDIEQIWLYDDKEWVLVRTSGSLYKLFHGGTIKIVEEKNIIPQPLGQRYLKVKNGDGLRLYDLITQKFVIKKATKWIDITDIHNGIAVVKVCERYYDLINLGENFKGGGKRGKYYIEYLLPDTYLGTNDGKLFYAFRYSGDGNNFSSCYNSIKSVAGSRELLIGYNDDTSMWSIMHIEDLTSFPIQTKKEPKVVENGIQLLLEDDYGKEVEVRMDFSGKLDNEDVQGFRKRVLSSKSGTKTTTKISELTNETEEKNSLQFFYHIVIKDDKEDVKYGKLGITTRRVEIPQKLPVSGYVCWIFPDRHEIIISQCEKKTTNGWQTIVNRISYTGEFKKSKKYNKFNKWEIEIDYKDIVESVAELFGGWKVDEDIPQTTNIEENIESQVCMKEAMQLRDTFILLKKQAFDEESICNALYVLFPNMEQLISYSYIGNDTPEIEESIEQLQCNISELAQTVKTTSGHNDLELKGNLVSLQTKLADKKRQLRRNIINGVVKSLAEIEMSAETFTETEKPEKFASLEAREVSIDKKVYKFKLGQRIDCNLLGKQSAFRKNEEFDYIRNKQIVCIILNENTASRQEQGKERFVKMKGSLLNNRFVQDFIQNNKQNSLLKIYVFKKEANNQCSFFDEYEYCNMDVNNNFIELTFKSLLRYNNIGLDNNIDEIDVTFEKAISSEEWDAAEWKERVNDAKGSKSEWYLMNEARLDIYNDTIRVVQKGSYKKQDVNVALSDSTLMCENTKFYNSPFSIDNCNIGRVYETYIEVRNQDSLVAGKDLLDKGLNPAVHIMANRQIPGGGVRYGFLAQEESIFMRSNVFKSLYQFNKYADEFGIERRTDGAYPMDRNFGGIYIPNAEIFRATELEGYDYLDTPYCLSFIAVAGMNSPQLDAQGMIVKELVEGIKNKMRTILRIGLINGHDSLVLGAMGCGNFKNPPSHIAALYKEILEECEFKNKYKKIIFAILEKDESPSNLCKTFSKILFRNE